MNLEAFREALLQKKHELSEAARARGAVMLEREEFAHPLMDRDLSARRARFELVRAFFAGRTR